MADLQEEFKSLKLKNKALKHHLKEEAALVEKQTKEIAELKEQFKTK